MIGPVISRKPVIAVFNEDGVEVYPPRQVMTATERQQALLDFADLLDHRRPSDVQVKIGNDDYNAGAVKALEWAAAEARRMAAAERKP